MVSTLCLLEIQEAMDAVEEHDGEPHGVFWQHVDEASERFASQFERYREPRSGARRNIPTIAAVRTANRRARARGLRADLTATQWSHVVSRYGNACAYCRRGGAMCLDHIEPLALGGPSTMTNVAPACAECNLSKNGKSLLAWTQDVGFKYAEIMDRIDLVNSIAKVNF